VHIAVLEKNPPKQGLKQEKPNTTRERVASFEKNPPKQGLKRKLRTESHDSKNDVLEKNPPKQGLKHASIFCKAL